VAGQEQDAAIGRSNGQPGINSPSSPQQHHQQMDPQQQPKPTLQLTQEQWLLLQARNQKHFQAFLNAVAQKYGGDPAAVYRQRDWRASNEPG